MKLLENKIVYVSRSRKQSSNEIHLLEEYGAKVIAFPSISINAISNTDNIDNTIKMIDQFNYLIFTSANAVKYFFKRIEELTKIIPDSLGVVAVGKKTQKACNNNKIKVDLVPNKYSAEGVLELLKTKVVSGDKILIPSSVISRDELAIGLRKLGAEVEVIPIYSNSSIGDNEYLDERSELVKSKPEAFVFTSPSSFSSFIKVANIENVKTYFSNSIVAAIGKTTKKTVESFDVKATVIPRISTLEETINELIKFYSSEAGV